jgi:proline iminopeptidase
MPYRDGYNVTARLGEIAVPTLITVGRDDFITPPSRAEIMHAGIPGSELVIFERSGHYPFVEEPEAFFAAAHDFLRRHSRRSWWAAARNRFRRRAGR